MIINDQKIRTIFFLTGIIFGVAMSAVAVVSIVTNWGPAWIRVLAVAYDVGFLLGIISGEGN
jgi:hypothetical protein